MRPTTPGTGGHDLSNSVHKVGGGVALKKCKRRYETWRKAKEYEEIQQETEKVKRKEYGFLEEVQARELCCVIGL